jgi:hypothetical protein
MVHLLNVAWRPNPQTQAVTHAGALERRSLKKAKK